MRLRVYFSLAWQRAAPEEKQPAAAASGVHKLTIDSAPKGAEATPPKVAGRVGAAALGATAFILTSSDDGGSNKTESLSSFQWLPK
jgi:hypothetical protein